MSYESLMSRLESALGGSPAGKTMALFLALACWVCGMVTPIPALFWIAMPLISRAKGPDLLGVLVKTPVLALAVLFGVTLLWVGRCLLLVSLRSAERT